QPAGRSLPAAAASSAARPQRGGRIDPRGVAAGVRGPGTDDLQFPPLEAARRAMWLSAVACLYHLGKPGRLAANLRGAGCRAIAVPCGVTGPLQERRLSPDG